VFKSSGNSIVSSDPKMLFLKNKLDRTSPTKRYKELSLATGPNAEKFMSPKNSMVETDD
jgi:hypothetical protein